MHAVLVLHEAGEPSTHALLCGHTQRLMVAYGTHEASMKGCPPAVACTVSAVR